MPRPLDVVAVGLEVNWVAGESASYDLAAGVSYRSAEFTMALGGKVLAIGGHLHQYGVELRLDDIASGKVIFSLRPTRGRSGEIRMPRQLFGVRGSGRTLTAGRRYRLTVTYDNTSGEPIPAGGMGVLAMLFAPDHPSDWPQTDGRDEGVNRELAVLRTRLVR